MTVTYQSEASSIGVFGVFRRLLCRWRGSIYKLVWADLLIYAGLYFALSLSYRFAMTPAQKSVFEEVSRYCATFNTFIPLSFVLGFYVTLVVQRWWDQYMAIPWPDSTAMLVSSSVQGLDERGRLLRRTIMRYVNLGFVYTMSLVCISVKKRFPTLSHLVEAGIMTETEQKIFEKMNQKTLYTKQWMPLVWAASVVTTARKEGRIRDDFAVKTLVDSLDGFRSGLGAVLGYDWISVPLVYTQTVTLAVYTFFVSELMGQQFLDTDDQTVDIFVPAFTLLRFFFYMGWLRVAETLFNPFGDDDDDFEINWMIDRNLQVSYIIVDEIHEEHPELIRDQYWENVVPPEMPYTVAAEPYRREPPPHGSTAQVEVSKEDMELVEAPPIPETVMEEKPGAAVASDEETAQISPPPVGAETGSALAEHPTPSEGSRRSSISTLRRSLTSAVSGRGSLSSLRRSLTRQARRLKGTRSSDPEGKLLPGELARQRRCSEGSQWRQPSPVGSQPAAQPAEMFVMSDMDANGGPPSPVAPASSETSPGPSSPEAPPGSPTAAPPESPAQAPPESPTAAPPESPTQAPPGSPTQAPPGPPSEAPPRPPSEAPPGSSPEAPLGSPTEAPPGSPPEAPLGPPADQTKQGDSRPTSQASSRGTQESMRSSDVQSKTGTDRDPASSFLPSDYHFLIPPVIEEDEHAGEEEANGVAPVGEATSAPAATSETTAIPTEGSVGEEPSKQQTLLKDLLNTIMAAAESSAPPPSVSAAPTTEGLDCSKPEDPPVAPL